MAKEIRLGPIEIDHLFIFLDGLQASGYKLDTRQYVALSDLLLTLIAQGQVADVAALKTIIAPLICSTPREQQDFYRHFDYWYFTLASSGQMVEVTKQRSSKWKLLFRNINWKTIFIITTIVIVILLTVTLITQSAKNGIQVNSTIVLSGFIITLLGLLCLLVWQMIVVYRKNQFIIREKAEREPVYTNIPIQTFLQDLVPVIKFKSIANSLKRRFQIPSNDVNVERTIENALQKGNWVEIIYRQKQVIPEYLVLIERKSHMDQQAQFVQDIIKRLAADGVWLHLYEFSENPLYCFPFDKKGYPLQLKDLKMRHPDARLLVFTGSEELANPLTGRLQDWLEPLTEWQERAILTSDKINKLLLEEMEAYNFTILPMTFNGLSSLIPAFEAGKNTLNLFELRSLPTQLAERPLRWTGYTAPSKSEITTLLEDLKQYLGQDGFHWLCASAVYPELRWEITIYLGITLKTDQQQSLLDPNVLLHLTCLPWFRLGFMPDWIRQILISQLSEYYEQSVRIALVNLIATLSGINSFSLNISQDRKRSFASQSRQLINYLKKNTTPSHPVHDYIFLRFVLGSRKRKLSIKLPQSIRRIIKEISLNNTTMNKARLRGNNSSEIGKLWLEWRGKDKATPQYKFMENEIVSPPYHRRVGRLTQATYVNLHPSHFAVGVSPDGRTVNLKGGYNQLSPGIYNIYYVDKQNRVNYIPRTAETTLDGFKVAIELVVSYRVIDPIRALEVQNPVDTLLRFIQANLQEFIRSHKYEEIVGDLDGRKIDNEQVALYIREQHIDRSPLAKLFYIIDVVVKERIGDPKVIELREKYHISLRQLEAQKVLQSLNQELEKKIVNQDALIKQIKARSAVEQQNIIQKVELQKIELEKARTDLQYRQENWKAAFDAIAQTLSNRTDPLDPAESEVIQELLTELRSSALSNESKERELFLQSEAIEASSEDLNKSRESPISEVNLNQVNLQETTAEEVVKNRYELQFQFLNVVEEIYKRAISENRLLTPDEAQTIEKLNNALTEYESHPVVNNSVSNKESKNSIPFTKRIKELTNSLIGWRKKK
jgi:hypothetical protein